MRSKATVWRPLPLLFAPFVTATVCGCLHHKQPAPGGGRVAARRVAPYMSAMAATLPPAPQAVATGPAGKVAHPPRGQGCQPGGGGSRTVAFNPYPLTVMAATRVITAVDPATGARITRRTARTYVAVVVTGDPAQGHAWAQNWCGRPDLAAKQLAKWGPDSHARLAPVMADPWATPEAAPAPEATPEAAPTPEALAWARAREARLWKLEEAAALAPEAAPEAKAAPAAQTTPAPAAPTPSRRRLGRLQGEARVLMARFSRCYRLTAPQAQALAVTVHSWAGRGGPGLWRVTPAGGPAQPAVALSRPLWRGLAARGVVVIEGPGLGWQSLALADLWGIAQAQARAEGLRPLRTLAEIRAAQAAPAAQAAQAAQAAPRPTLPGEATPPPAPAPLGDAAPALPPLPVAAPADRVAAHRAAAAAGRPVSLAALARDLGLGLASGGRLPRYGATGEPAPRPAPAALADHPTGDAWAGQPWDPGTPEARARVADQGRIAARLHPIARAATGAGCTLPPSWASDGPALNGELPPMRALEALPLPTLAAAAAALAALPPVTEAQAHGLAYCRAALRARAARL